MIPDPTIQSKGWPISARRTILFALAVMLVVFGFAIDGASETGHHAGLIVGGILLGWGLRESS